MTTKEKAMPLNTLEKKFVDIENRLNKLEKIVKSDEIVLTGEAGSIRIAITPEITGIIVHDKQNTVCLAATEFFAGFYVYNTRHPEAATVAIVVDNFGEAQLQAINGEAVLSTPFSSLNIKDEELSLLEKKR